MQLYRKSLFWPFARIEPTLFASLNIKLRRLVRWFKWHDIIQDQKELLKYWNGVCESCNFDCHSKITSVFSACAFCSVSNLLDLLSSRTNRSLSVNVLLLLSYEPFESIYRTNYITGILCCINLPHSAQIMEF